ncbi:MAG TPA: class II fumarate hydratase [Candidatus Limnocylindrales bacterium]|nr:class II fumarate hydratase [Candidatus Limnocylindrales bacterium]
MSTDTPAGTPATRIERDSMGEMEVPADALYGASTQRAVLNFPISGQPLPRRFLRALALVKLAAAETNEGLGLLEPAKAQAIAAAARDVAGGGYDAHFPIDVYQTGSGTSTNTNMNEVISHLASARLGGAKVHPNDDVNKCQSSNDTIPTALQLSAALAIEEELIPALIDLQEALAAKADEFWPIVKTGRTHLQDATPIRLGQEFAGYAGQVEEAIRRAQAARDELLVVPLGGTAVGTGINAHQEYAARACGRLSELTGLLVRETNNHFHAQATLDAAIAAHGGLRAIALGLWKIASDVRLMGMGPRAGIAELALPETQPGSSIMPGKVNPVIVESLTMVVARVIGNDATVAFGQTGSFLELNVMLPVTALAMLESIALLAASARNFRVKLVEGVQATARGPQLVEQGLMLATALAPEIGYDAAAAMAKEGFKSGRTIRELALEKGIAPDRLDELLDPAKMTEPGLDGGPGGG